MPPAREEHSIQKNRKTQEEERIGGGWCGACQQEFLRMGMREFIKDVIIDDWQGESSYFFQLLTGAV
jgi:hypothetical protein